MVPNKQKTGGGIKTVCIGWWVIPDSEQLGITRQNVRLIRSILLLNPCFLTPRSPPGGRMRVSWMPVRLVEELVGLVGGQLRPMCDGQHEMCEIRLIDMVC